MKIATAILLMAAATALYSQRPALTAGISVQMVTAPHAVETPAADDTSAIVVAITADGRTFLGTQPVEPAALSNLNGTVYVKADARAPYQQLLSVLDALRGKSVVLLSASPAIAAKQGYLPPYGTPLTVAR